MSFSGNTISSTAHALLNDAQTDHEEYGTHDNTAVQPHPVSIRTKGSPAREHIAARQSNPPE